MIDLDKVQRVSFYRAILECKNETELEALCHDLLAPVERENLTDRWNIAQSKLATNCSNNLLKKYHKASQELVERVVQELDQKLNPVGDKGYRTVFRRIFGPPFDEK